MPNLMNAKSDLISIVLGPEYSERHRKALGIVLRREGAVRLDEKMHIAGSQLIETYTFSINGEQVTIESETFAGLSITCPTELVEGFADKVRREANEQNDEAEC